MLSPSQNLVVALVGSAFAAAFATHAGAEELTDTLKKIKDSHRIIIGYRESSVPLSYLDGNQKPVGFTIDLCGLVVDKVKQKLDMPKLEVDYNPVNSATRIPLVANNTVDLECGSTANQLARQKQVAFYISFFIPQFRWITRTDSGVSTAGDLKDKRVAATAGTGTALFLNRLNQQNAMGLTILSGKDHADSFLLMDTGRAAAFIEDDILLAGLRANAKDPKAFKFLEETYPSDPYGIMMRRDDPEFKKLVDSVIIDTMKSGKFEQLYHKWFEQPIPPNSINLNFPMPDELKAQIKNPNDRAIN